MRPVLRDDAYHVAVDGGAYILTHQGPVRLTGVSVAQWLEQIGPHLDGTRTLAELTAPLPPDRRELVEKLVAALHTRGVVRDLSNGRGGPPAGAPEVSYVGYFREAAGATVARYQATAVLVIGSGPLLPALVDAARCSGLTRLRVVDTGAAPRPGPESPEDWSRRPDSGEAELAALVAGTELVLHAADLRVPEAALRIARAGAHAGVPVAQAVAGPGEVWLAPADDPGRPVWSAAWPRLAARSPGGGGSGISAAAAAAAASQLVHHAFRAITGVAAPADRIRLTRVDGETLASEEHRVLPHPFQAQAAATTEAEARDRIAELRQGARLTEEELSRQAVACLDERLGVFSYQEHDWAQVPLHVTEAVVPDPVTAGGPEVTATGAGFSFLTARCQAALGALARYGSRLVDPRKLPADGQVWGAEVGDPVRLRPVPAAAAFPPPGDRPTGLAAGYDWQEAVASGVVDHCLALTLAEVSAASTRCPRVDPNGAELDETGQRCRDILADLSEPLEVYDVTGSLGVPTFAFCLGATTIAYRAGLSSPDALAGGLRQVLLAVQARWHGQTGYAPEPVVPLPGHRRGGLDAGTRPGLDLPAVAGRLRDRGLTAVSVPLDHDPEVFAVMPYLVQVVTLDDR